MIGFHTIFRGKVIPYWTHKGSATMSIFLFCATCLMNNLPSKKGNLNIWNIKYLYYYIINHQWCILWNVQCIMFGNACILLGKKSVILYRLKWLLHVAPRVQTRCHAIWIASFLPFVSSKKRCKSHVLQWFCFILEQTIPIDVFVSYYYVSSFRTIEMIYSNNQRNGC